MSATLTLPSRVVTQPLQRRPVATPGTMRQPATTLTTREVRSLPLTGTEQAVAQFLAQYPQCGSAEEITRFIQLVKVANWRGVDIRSVLRTLDLGGTIDGSVPYSGQARVADLQFTPATEGQRGRRKEKQLPSLLWQIVLNNCGDLYDLNVGIASVLEGTYGLTVPETPPPPPSSAPPSAEEVNQGLSELFAAYPECRMNRDAIYQLLNLIDNHNLVGRDVFALFRTLGLEGHLPSVPPSSGYRVADLTVARATPPVRGEALEKQVYKESLLWMLLSEYCDQIDDIVPELNNILSGQIRANQLGQPGPLSDIATRFEEAPPQQRQTQTSRRGRRVRQSTSAQNPVGPVPPRGTPGARRPTQQQQQQTFAAPAPAARRERPGAAFVPAGVRR